MSDRIREEWEKNYPGHTDDGWELPISQVTPGMFVCGMPVGYWPAESPEQVENAWLYQPINIS